MRPIGRPAFLTGAPDTNLLSSINTQKQNPAEIDGVCQRSEAEHCSAFSRIFRNLELDLETTRDRRDEIVTEVVADFCAGLISVLTIHYPGMAAG